MIFDRQAHRTHPLGSALAVVFLLVGVVLVYANSLNGPFIYDDTGSIPENASIRSLRTVLSPPVQETVAGRPLLNLSFALNYAAGDLDVRGYHVTNVAIHWLAALALFGLVRRSLLLPRLRDRFGAQATEIALVVSALWMLHPVQTESVTYIVQRAESLMGLCYLATLYFYLRGATSSRGTLWFVASAMVCAAGMATKEVMVSAPVIIFLYDWAFVSGGAKAAWTGRRGALLGLASTWILLGYLVWSTGGDRGGSTGGFGQEAQAWQYWLTQFEAIATYLRLSFWPHPLVYEYGFQWVDSWYSVLPYATVVVAGIAATFIAWFRCPPVGFLGLWFFAILAPTSVIPGTTQMTVEHRLYLALVPLMVLGVIAAFRWAGRPGLLVCAAVAVAFGFLAHLRNRDYRTDLSLWEDTVRKQPTNPRAHRILGNALAKHPERLEEGIAELETALRLKPDFALAHANLSAVLLPIAGRFPDALAHAEKAVELRPDSPNARTDRANAWSVQPGRLEEAISEYREVLRQKPHYAIAWLNLGKALARQPAGEKEALAAFENAQRYKVDWPDLEYCWGALLSKFPDRRVEAIAHLREAIRLKPEYWEAHYTLGSVLAESPEDASEALQEFAAVVRLNPQSAEGHLNLGTALANLPGRMSDALVEFETAVRIDPQNVDAQFDLGTALTALGRGNEAVAYFDDVLKKRPTDTDAQLALGQILANLAGRHAEAQSYFEAVLRTKPESAVAHYALGVLLTEQASRHAEAVSHFETAVRLQPSMEEARHALDELRTGHAKNKSER